MDLTQSSRADWGFPCRNPLCREARHSHPSCPHELLHQVFSPPYPPSVTTLRAAQQLRQLKEEGRLPRVEPLPVWWIWLIPPALVVLFLLMLF
ncbi:hypothetical protein AB0M34_12800 [Nocardia sp. NPDC050193]